MRNNRRPMIIAITFIIVLFAFADGKAAESSPGADEYALMSLLIDDEYEGEFSLILINSETEPWCMGGEFVVIRKEWPRLKPETIDALIVSNRGASSRLEKRFDIPVEYRLMSEAEYAEVLNCGRNAAGPRTLEAGGASTGTGMEQYASKAGPAAPDWDSFDSRFPDAQGYLTFSRAGFDPEMSQALVVFSNAYRCNGVRTRPEKRRVAFFVKNDGEWELVGVSKGIEAMY